MVADLIADHPTSSPTWWLAIIKQLPLEGAFFAAVQGGPEFRGWTVEAYVDSYIFDAVQVSNAKGTKKKRIDTFPRPADKKKNNKRVATLAEALP